jgi:fructose-bisphosphate aldolase class II
LAGGTVTLAATADLVASAASTGTAVLAFNVITIEHAEGVADGAERAGAATILQISENTVRFHARRMAPLATACAQIARHSSAALSVHLDHAHAAGLWVEAELGEIGGKDGATADAHELGVAVAAVADPRKYLAAGRHAIGDTVAELCRAVASVRDRELR